ncbi:MAG TPA: hypothetical protein VN181_14855, partial [Thermoanaerobaculia bacterium]|nr:hypothetical protein [Thermoanaerobaculia bacterium]
MTIDIPLGIRYDVSPTLSYQFHLIHNSKVRDTYWVPCVQNFRDARCERSYPNLASNAGLGWRISLGQLLPPVDEGRSLDRVNLYVYEGPTGEQYDIHTDEADNRQILGSSQYFGPSLRMIRIDEQNRELEFPSGEVHHFKRVGRRFDDSRVWVWRLTEIRDRKDPNTPNKVSIKYLPEIPPNGDTRESAWIITDSVGREHRIDFSSVYHRMNDGWSQGRQIETVQLAGFTTPYRLGKSGRVSAACPDPTPANPFDDVPLLTLLRLPDDTTYTFTYGGGEIACEPNLQKVVLPTGGSIEYEYQQFHLGGWDACPNTWPSDYSPAIKSRKVSDGEGSRTWRYEQRVGPQIPVTFASDPCGYGGEDPFGAPDPSFWSRTSVITPPDAAGKTTRTDHYFNIIPENGHFLYKDRNTDEPIPLFDIPHSVYGFSGTVAKPSAFGPLENSSA